MKMNHVELLSLLKDNRWEKVIKAKWPINPAGYRLSRLAERLEKLERAYWRTREQIIKRYAETDDNGQIKTKESGEVLFPSVEAEGACRKDLLDLDLTEVDVVENKITVKLEQIPEELTPSELSIVLKFIDIEDGGE